MVPEIAALYKLAREVMSIFVLFRVMFRSWTSVTSVGVVTLNVAATVVW